MPFSVPHRAGGRACAARRIAVLLLSGLTLAAVPAAGPLAQTTPPVVQESRDPFAAHVAEASLRFGIPPGWIRAVRHVESRGDPQAVSSKGAMGLMQIMPETWAALRARHALGSDPFDPRDNILAGAAYLREMHDRYGNVAAMLAAYNAGPGRYDEYLVSDRTLPAETRAYVAMLAPLGGDPLPGTGFAAAPPTDWHEAPLFAGSMIDGPDAERPQPGGLFVRRSAAEPVLSDGALAADPEPPAGPSDTASDAVAPQSDALFVRRSDAGSVQ
ncbi:MULTISPECIES: lytic transglycosylase domain-containing protein [Paracoccus]|uniref:Transglycosylase-like protein with SLT domain n=1 Tax=Paracoccus versutus TaxID=34007 RepID=A0A3D9XFH9_PARVE|nr:MULTISPECIES: lytic transglycosylase domain-containing protein [Paracoccus]REF68308.1 transglycosylase-like protein with SLT domain [Paracoccus versutus]WGR58971.1 lytic transglycosylase domain-containing protein [Paracoccus versutus]SFY25011.1 Transglycosylase SLT domain-containing protein [Paracoccus pantotrophus]